MIEIVVNALKERPGKFRACLGERVLHAGSRQPLLDCARILLGEGIDPQARIGMRYAGADDVALTSTVGAAAKLTVRENDWEGPRFVPWAPFEIGRIGVTSGHPGDSSEPPSPG